MGKRGVKLEKQKKKNENEKLKWNLLLFNQNSPCTRGRLDDTCTTHHNMQEDTSSTLTERLDGGTKLMDVWRIQELIWYFA